LGAYAALTRLPTPLRAPAAVVGEYLRRRHLGARLVPSGAARRTLIARLAGLGIAGGAVCDALIAATAEAHGQELIALDRRAAASYARLGVAARLI
jgi:predicted nucleic acid-binding protein